MTNVSAHVSEQEQRDAANPAVGDGDATTAPEKTLDPSDWTETPVTVGVSPKALAAAVAALVVFVCAEVGLDLPAGVTAAVETVVVFAAAWLAKPGVVVSPEVVDA